MGNLTVSLEEILKKGEAVKGVTITGLLAELEDNLTKNSKPYVKGKLINKENSIPIKVWDTNLKIFCEKNGISENEVKVVHATGDTDIYEGQMQFTLRPNANGQSAIVDDTINPESLAPQSIFSPESMLSAITGSLDNFIQNEPLNRAVKIFLEKFQKEIMYYPYGQEDHTEKGGWLSHVYNCISRYVGYKGEPKDIDGSSVIERSVIIAALICHSSRAFTTLQVDSLTGAVMKVNEWDNALMGEWGNFFTMNIFLLQAVSETGGKITPEVKNFLNCCLAANGLIAPSTLEAVITSNIVNSELNEHRIFNSLKTIKNGEKKKVTLTNGEETYIARQ